MVKPGVDRRRQAPMSWIATIKAAIARTAAQTCTCVPRSVGTGWCARSPAPESRSSAAGAATTGADPVTRMDRSFEHQQKDQQERSNQTGVVSDPEGVDTYGHRPELRQLRRIRKSPACRRSKGEFHRRDARWNNGRMYHANEGSPDAYVAAEVVESGPRRPSRTLTRP